MLPRAFGFEPEVRDGPWSACDQGWQRERAGRSDTFGLRSHRSRSENVRGGSTGRSRFASGERPRRAAGDKHETQRRTRAETAVHDPSCVAPQVLQFEAVLWGPASAAKRVLPPSAGDSTSAATAINDAGEVVGISGACDVAVGAFSARHALLWVTSWPSLHLGRAILPQWPGAVHSSARARCCRRHCVNG